MLCNVILNFLIACTYHNFKFVDKTFKPPRFEKNLNIPPLNFFGKLCSTMLNLGYFNNNIFKGSNLI